MVKLLDSKVREFESSKVAASLFVLRFAMPLALPLCSQAFLRQPGFADSELLALAVFTQEKSIGCATKIQAATTAPAGDIMAEMRRTRLPKTAERTMTG